LEEGRVGLEAHLHHCADRLQRISLQPEGVSLFERHPPHFSTGVYKVWRIAAKASPEGARALALRPGELLPLARRIGPEALELEARVSGLPVHVSQQFGDDAVRYFAVQVPAKDATRLVGLAQRADSQATRELLLNTYKDKGAAFLQRLDWKVVLATGLSTAMITGTYKVSDGIQDGLKKVAVSLRAPSPT
jgi:hypothetical protein